MAGGAIRLRHWRASKDLLTYGLEGGTTLLDAGANPRKTFSVIQARYLDRYARLALGLFAQKLAC